MKIIVGTILYIITFTGYAQESNVFKPSADPVSNPVILKYFNPQQVENMRLNDTLAYNTLIYVLTESFSLEKLTCTDCSETDLQFIDVMDWEYLRKNNETVTAEFPKYGFKITLVPVEEMKYRLPVHFHKLNQ